VTSLPAPTLRPGPADGIGPANEFQRRPNDARGPPGPPEEWAQDPGPAAARRAEAAGYDKPIAELRELNSEVLAIAAGLSHGTIETVLAKSDPQPGAEALLRGPRA
jgi:hypothetical protein